MITARLHYPGGPSLQDAVARQGTMRRSAPVPRHMHRWYYSGSANCTPLSAAGPAGAFEAGSESATRTRLFNRISPVYDQLNDVLSLGLHRVWKRAAVKWSGAVKGGTVLDICCGSGDLAMRLAQTVGISGKVVGLDFAQEMLDDASARDSVLAAYWERAPIDWVKGDAQELPFDDSLFDAVTIGYGLRNVADIPRTLSEVHRVLRPGGKVAVLDFNNNGSDSASDAVQGWALENVVVPAASLYGLKQEYEYLRPSIQRFPSGPQQEELALTAGFKAADHYELAFGLMGCLVAEKARQ